VIFSAMACFVMRAMSPTTCAQGTVRFHGGPTIAQATGGPALRRRRRHARRLFSRKFRLAFVRVHRPLASFYETREVRRGEPTAARQCIGHAFDLAPVLDHRGSRHRLISRERVIHLSGVERRARDQSGQCLRLLAVAAVERRRAAPKFRLRRRYRTDRHEQILWLVRAQLSRHADRAAAGRLDRDARNVYTVTSRHNEMTGFMESEGSAHEDPSVVLLGASASSTHARGNPAARARASTASRCAR
jgi:hypothetical protein